MQMLWHTIRVLMYVRSSKPATVGQSKVLKIHEIKIRKRQITAQPCNMETDGASSNLDSATSDWQMRGQHIHCHSNIYSGASVTRKG